jgi:hypothetical protein
MHASGMLIDSAAQIVAETNVDFLRRRIDQHINITHRLIIKMVREPLLPKLRG